MIGNLGARADMATGSIKLVDHPGDLVRLACENCGRAGQSRKQNLIAQFGDDIALPDLRHEVAKCERRGKLGDACAVHYVGLANNQLL